ncbi:hypothetical protein LTR91_015362 [Friedmanniomyces endolithicus]|uniref:Ribosomal protein L19 n=1 Tax=Friedmanniomyces endolithicus TaxID=329885 RepID=A0AAN6J077_9PEZI|nr:hypothetical protein LTS09_001331 [Friedmanniomyces endolithicus]KAK0291893.1 hypothetical protein LTR35_001321 [Friedmanniomyces endolithicus]KAK0296431.1 hypothetical protein LTS00_004756 [Friedmanniomyces endolithicus]KAK0305016.1 hypothetical protein LTR82_016968 [Friedmanniomyces endolithicus]KAK0931930.1 hypothetical protein LTR57_000149 [Friedmanniomyces endolithicus]
MSLSAPVRPLACIRQAIRQCRTERQQTRRYAAPATEVEYPSLQTRYPPPTPGFRPSQAIKQNRFETGLKKIPVVPPPRSTTKACPDPISILTNKQISVLDPTGARTRLFSPANPERVQPGDILVVRLRTGDPVSGVVLNIRQRHQPIDTAILLRNQLTRVGVEVWFKVYSPNVEGIEVVQRAVKRARRAKLYYMRQPRHDVGSVEGVVKQYLRQRSGGPLGNREANTGRKTGSKKGRK